jgi:hypothetical protein
MRSQIDTSSPSKNYFISDFTSLLPCIPILYASIFVEGNLLRRAGNKS